eukprot:gnl/TRDRNA2_/TRDRNA2_39810_c0_seq1.p1 gnl/TRDRNA2_/TRDRNA2_39810_c0~~gnl/TRDRNA2_/TRDRNA2_39810_c0_seq1.p1  ORF type:complete len:368 (+),score=37.21 gnl/TRDRNA2_/TRDRNA2_39810_c0_seq1:64-1167(+)
MENDGYGATKLESPKGTEMTMKVTWKATLLTHGAMMLIYFIYGQSDITLKLGMDHTNPIVLELIREVSVGLAFTFIAVNQGNLLIPSRPDMPLVVSLGFLWFAAMTCEVVGIKWSDAIVFAAWQPVTPIACSALAVLVGFEQISLSKAVGIFLASGGATTMVLLDRHRDVYHGGSNLVVHFLFFVYVFCMAGFIVVSKWLLSKYPFASVSSWAFGGSACFMSCLALLGNASPSLLATFCYSADKRKTLACITYDFEIPPADFGYLAYQIVVSNLFASGLSIYLTKHVKVSVISVYTAAQPVAVALLSSFYIGIFGQDWGDSHGIFVAGRAQIVGTLFIAMGLFCVSWEGLFDDEVLQSRDVSTPLSP